MRELPTVVKRMTLARDFSRGELGKFEEVQKLGYNGIVYQVSDDGKDYIELGETFDVDADWEKGTFKDYFDGCTCWLRSCRGYCRESGRAKYILLYRRLVRGIVVRLSTWDVRSCLWQPPQ